MDAAARVGRQWSNVRRYADFFATCGFKNVVERRFYWPAGTWAQGTYYKSLGAFFEEDIRRGIEPISMKLLPVLGMGQREIGELLEKVWKELGKPDIFAYLEM